MTIPKSIKNQVIYWSNKPPINEFWSIAFCFILLLVFLLLGETPADSGDGLQHFAISNLTWTNPASLFNHWGKPLFILFSAPFAYVGFKTYIFFNIVCYLVTVFLGIKIFKKIHIPLWYSILFPLFLLSSRDYLLGIISGHTEVFFNLLLTLSLWTLLQKKYLFFAILISFTPFARSEGMLLIPASFCLLLYLKQYKCIPILFLGFLIYSTLGWFVLGDFWWYFTTNPYPEISVYGAGNWYDYLLSSKYYLGYCNLILILFATFRLIHVLFRTKIKKLNEIDLILVFYSLLFILNILVHSYLWSSGLKGAAGLSRLGTMILVPFMIAVIFYASRFIQMVRPQLRLVLFGLLLFFIFQGIIGAKLPTNKNENDKLYSKVLKDLKSYNHKGRTIFYFHPIVSYFRGTTILNEKKPFRFSYLNLEQNLKPGEQLIKEGDLILRDSYFGPREQGLSFEELKKFPFIKPVKHYYFPDCAIESNGEYRSIIVYQVFKKDNQNIFTKKQKIPSSLKRRKINGNKEFTLVENSFKLPSKTASSMELFVEIENTNDVSELYFVFNDQKNQLIAVPIPNGKSELKLLIAPSTTMGKLYIRNPKNQEFQLNLLNSFMELGIDQGIQKHP